MRDSDPPICSVHAGRPLDAATGTPPGAQPGNDNALLHGFYSRFLRDADGNLVEDTGGLTLIGEIAITRVALHRALTMLVTGTTLGTRPRRLSATDLARLIGLAFAGARTVGRLVEVSHNIGGDGQSAFQQAIDQMLDELSEQWGGSF
jgi:hypothetical protein